MPCAPNACLASLGNLQLDLSTAFGASQNRFADAEDRMIVSVQIFLHDTQPKVSLRQVLRPDPGDSLIPGADENDGSKLALVASELL